MSFFVSHPVGRLLNRFSKDTAVADSVLVKQLLSIFQVGGMLSNTVPIDFIGLYFPCSLGLPFSTIYDPFHSSGCLGAHISLPHCHY